VATVFGEGAGGVLAGRTQGARGATAARSMTCASAAWTARVYWPRARRRTCSATRGSRPGAYPAGQPRGRTAAGAAQEECPSLRRPARDLAADPCGRHIGESKDVTPPSIAGTGSWPSSCAPRTRSITWSFRSSGRSPGRSRPWGRSHATGLGDPRPDADPMQPQQGRLEPADASWLATVRCQPRTARRAGDHVGIATREVAATPEQDG